MKRATLRLVVLIGLAGLLLFGAFWIIRAKQALEQAEFDLSGSAIPFQVRPISVTQSGTMDFLPSPPAFRDVQLFQDSIYLCGAGGVWAYDMAGNPKAAYLVGRDLPPSPPVAMAVGTVAGNAAPRLWIATATAGILTFDGVRFSQIQFQAAGGGNITSLLLLPTGLLLAGLSEGGVIAYNGATLAPFHAALRNITVTAIAGNEGDLWVGTRDRGILHWSAGSTEEFREENGLPDNRILSIVAAQDRVFVGTPLGVSEFRDGRHLRNIAEGVFSLALLASQERLLVGTVDQGIVDVNLETTPRFTSAPDSQPIDVRRLTEIQGAVFALTPEGFYEREHSGLWTRQIAAAKGSWTNRNVAALSVDSLGKLWVGYFDNGLDIIRAGSGPLHVEDDQVFCVNRIISDPERNLQVVATANGLVMFTLQGGVVRRMSRSDGLISEHVTDVVVGSGGLAVATAAGVTLLDGAGPQSIYAFHGLPNNHVYALGSMGPRLLAGTLGGLSLIQDGVVRASYTTANSALKQNWISAVVPHKEGWFIGTYGEGVFHLDADGQWADFPDVPPKTVVNPNAMIAVGDRVFAGTLDRGLLVYDAKDERWTPANDGLPSLNVTALAASSSGDLFIGTDNGVVRVPAGGLFK